MRPLKTSQRILSYLYVSQPDESTSKLKKMAMLFSSLTILFANVGSISCVTVFFFNKLKTDLEESLFALFQISAIYCVIYMSILGIILRQNFKDLFDNLAELYDRFKDLDSNGHFEQADNQSKRMWRIYFRIAFGCFMILSMGAVTSVLLCLILTGQFDAVLLYHPYKVSFAWDVTTPIGYFSEMFIDIAGAEGYIAIAGAFLLLFVSLCLYHQAFYQIFRQSLHKFNDSKRERIGKELFCELIRFHISAKNWFSDSAEVYSFVVVGLLISSMIALACAIFQIDLQIRHGPDLNIMSLLICCMCTLSNLFLYCYYGKSATDSYIQMGDALYESNWPDMPIELQKYTILMITNMQTPLHYHGFGVVVLNLETFTNCIKSVWSYYMMFKTLTSN